MNIEYKQRNLYDWIIVAKVLVILCQLQHVMGA